MVNINDSVLERFIDEDVPYIDLTSHILGIEEQSGSISYIARENICVCGTEEVKKIFDKYDLEVLNYKRSGTFLKKGEVLLQAKGRADALHLVWKVCVNILENASGVATRVQKFVESAKDVNPKVEIVTTRKIFPGTKQLATKAVLVGGAYPHRLGLGESILVFEEHLRFYGGLDKFIDNLKELKQKACEKMIAVEAHNIEDALKLAKANVDIIQLDKFSIEDLKTAVKQIKEISPNTRISAAGGINMQNVKEISACGADLLVTSSLYFGKPADIKADIQLLR
ncbi:MAG: ModD protein [Sulfurospirillaceae bacterium]|nr:ModD protein [Sulfurospirillaceae bacterium]